MKESHGSSPRARGTEAAVVLDANHLRFIPARAGNGIKIGKSLSTTSVHPRARGERLKAEPSAYNDVGSSPRARGTAPSSFRRTR